MTAEEKAPALALKYLPKRDVSTIGLACEIAQLIINERKRIYLKCYKDMLDEFEKMNKSLYHGETRGPLRTFLEARLAKCK